MDNYFQMNMTKAEIDAFSNLSLAHIGDGVFEVMLIRAPRNLTEISECIQAFQSQRYNDCAMVTFCPARKVKITAEADMPWTLDGEKFDGREEIEVENLQHAIRLMQKVNHDA